MRVLISGCTMLLGGRFQGVATYKVIVYTLNKAKTREADAHIRYICASASLVFALLWV